jgi:hypothetical protein
VLTYKTKKKQIFNTHLLYHGFVRIARRPLIYGAIMQKEKVNTIINEIINKPLPRSSKYGFDMFSGSHLTSNPIAIKYLIDGFVEENITGLVYGPSENGKSLVLLDWAFCITNGIQWEGRKTKQSEVLIIAGEGHAGYTRRLKALEIKYGMTTSTDLLISKSSIRLDDPDYCNDVAQFLKDSNRNPSLIIIDTLHRNMEGDENSSRDIANVLGNIDQYFRSTGAAVIIVHHTGHNQDRARGSSSIRASVDSEYSVFRDNNTITLSCTKGKDMEKPKPISFEIKQVDLDWKINDTDLRPQTSVYLECIGEAVKKQRKSNLNARETQVLQSINDAIKDKGIKPTDEIKQVFGDKVSNIVSIEDWRAYAYKYIPSDSKNPSRDLSRLRNKFLDRKLIIEYCGYIWIVNN